jgi:anti-sigma factor RsiW
MTCRSPLSWEDLVAYWAADLTPADQDRVDEHLLGCETCTAQAARVYAVVQALREVIPPVVTRRMLESLRARGLKVEEHAFAPGERREAIFAKGVDVLVHRLSGFELSGAQRVNVTLRVENSARVLAEIPSAPFDVREGVLIACQLHYSNMPPDVVFEVSAVDATGAERSASYTILHVFPA